MSALPSTTVESEATRVLYERHSGRILAYCRSRLGTREEAEDAVQITFMNAFRGLQRGIAPEHEAAWLYKIAENVCRERRRSAWRRGRVEATRDLHALEDQIPAPPPADDALDGLGEALARIPASQSRAILLREWRGLSYREIADELSLSQGAVETLLFRARRSLAQQLKARQETSKRRALDVLSLLGTVKSPLQGAAAVKVAAAVAAAATGVTLVAGAPLWDDLRPAQGRALEAEPGLAFATQAESPLRTRVATGGLIPRPVTPRPGLARSVSPAVEPRAGSLPAPATPSSPVPSPSPPTVQPTAKPSEPRRPAAPAPAAPAPEAPAPARSEEPPPAPSLPLLPSLPPVPSVPPLPELPPIDVSVPPAPPLPSLPPVPVLPAPQLPVPQLPKLP
ncbi:MAG: RNA polymerase sigma factor [Gaiellaceae bacterium]